MKLSRWVFLVLFIASTSSARDYQDPDHLLPLTANQPWRTHYFEALHSRFKIDPVAYVEMAIMPSFGQPESAIWLHPGEEDHWIEKADKIFLTYATAEKSIEQAAPYPDSKKQPEDIAVKSTTIEFPKPLALRLYNLWSKMLLRTRFNQKPMSIVTDGTGVEFGWGKAGWGEPYGETYLPTHAKSPVLFTDVGLALMDYAKAAPAKRTAAAKKIERAAARLGEYLSKHPAK